MSENSITNRLDNLQSDISHFNVLPPKQQPKRPGNCKFFLFFFFKNVLFINLKIIFWINK